MQHPGLCRGIRRVLAWLGFGVSRGLGFRVQGVGHAWGVFHGGGGRDIFVQRCKASRADLQPRQRELDVRAPALEGEDFVNLNFEPPPSLRLFLGFGGCRAPCHYVLSRSRALSP